MTTLRIVRLVMTVGTAIAYGVTPDSAADVQPAIAAVRDADALEDAACAFASKPERGARGIERVVVGANLDCEIWVNVDGRNERLRSSPRNTCDRGWDLLGKGQRVR